MSNSETILRKPGLAWITFAKSEGREFTDIAAQLGCGSVALLGNAPMPGFGKPISLHDVDAIKSTLVANDMIVSSLDMLPILPNFDPTAHDALLTLGSALGARQIGAAVLDPDGIRAAAGIRAFAERANSHDLRVGVEFVSFSPLRTLADAVSLIDRVGDPNVQITFDVLHFVRTGGVAEDLVPSSTDKIGYVQISDGPQGMNQDRLMWEAGSQRMVPGEGSFDLAGIFARLPAHVTIDIEAPMQSWDEQGIAPLEQGRRLVGATTALLAQWGR